jgi:RNA polymerase primary sigma factor
MTYNTTYHCRQIVNEDFVNYLKEISKFPLLTAEEETKLAVAAKNGDKSASDKLIKSNLKLVIAYAKKYCFIGMDIFDLIQSGNVGLMTALKYYDPSLGYKFSTYAMPWIKNACLHYVAEMNGTISLDHHVIDAMHTIRSVAESELHTDIFDLTNADIEKISKKTKISVKKITNVIRACAPCRSLDAIVGDTDGITVAEVIPDINTPNTEDEFIRNELCEELSGYVDKLPERERTVIKNRFGFGDEDSKTLLEVGRQMNISRERVRQIEFKALKELKRDLIRNDKKYACV